MSKPIFPLNESTEILEGEQLVMPEFAETPKEEKTVTDDVKPDIATPTTPQDDITDLDISVTAKKRFRFDKDNNRVIEINTSDIGIISRISEAYPKLQDLQTKASKMMEDVDFNNESEIDINMKKVSSRLKKVDTEMRELIDFIFDSDISSKAAPSGSMYDPFNGSFRFEYILTLLINQYEKNLTQEYSKIEKQFNQHTAKYTKG